MINNTQHIDGLPGLTMPGVKGSTGSRGAMTFYNVDSSTLFSTSYMFSLGFIVSDSSNDISYSKSETDTNNKVMSICSKGIQPILYDNVLVNMSGSTVQYQVVNTIDISYNDASIYKTGTAEDIGNSLSHNQISVLNYLNTIDTGNLDTDETEETVVSTLLDTIIAELADTTDVFRSYMLKELDTWNYATSSALDETDYTLTLSTRHITYDSWNGSYAKKEAKCSSIGHKISVGTSIDIGISSAKDEIRKKINEAEDSLEKPEAGYDNDSYITSLETVVNTLFGATDESSDTIKFYLFAGEKDDPYGMFNPVKGATLKVYTAYMSKKYNSRNTHMSDSLKFDDKPIVAETSRIDGSLEIDKSILVTNEKINGSDCIRFVYCITAEQVAGMSPLAENTVYIPYKSSYKNGDNGTYANYYTVLYAGSDQTFTYYDMIPYYDTSSVDSSAYTKNDIAVVVAAVTTSLDESQASNYKLEMEFLPNNQGINCMNMSSVVPDLWIGVASSEILTSSSAKGSIKNYSASLNFDNEYPGRFVYTLKDYIDKNNALSAFKKVIYMNASLIDQYQVHLYIYSKTSSTASSKIYLGEYKFN